MLRVAVERMDRDCWSYVTSLVAFIIRDTPWGSNHTAIWFCQWAKVMDPEATETGRTGCRTGKDVKLFRTIDWSLYTSYVALAQSWTTHMYESGLNRMCVDQNIWCINFEVVVTRYHHVKVCSPLSLTLASENVGRTKSPTLVMWDLQNPFLVVWALQIYSRR